jgi:branched-chain amino acid transport system permease protein
MHFFKDLTKHWQLLMGGFIVLVVVFAPRGLLGVVGQLSKKREAP